MIYFKMNPWLIACGVTILILFTEAKFIDLTHAFSEKTLYWNAETFRRGVIWQGKRDGIPYYSAFNSAAEHGGTHLDAPVHFAEGKWDFADIPVERLVASGVVVDVSYECSKDRNYQLTVADLRQWEATHGRIPDTGILLVHTGWARYWPHYEKYFGTNTKNGSLYRFPGIHESAARWLVENRNVNGVGIDTPSLDYGKTKTFPTHQILCRNNIYGLQNVANLDQLPATGATIFALPMKIVGGSGAPVRLIAAVNNFDFGRLEL